MADNRLYLVHPYSGKRVTLANRHGGRWKLMDHHVERVRAFFVKLEIEGDLDNLVLEIEHPSTTLASNQK